MDTGSRAFHDSLIVIDGHCDTALEILGQRWGEEKAAPRDITLRGDRGHIDIPRLLEGGVTCQTMALFTYDSQVAEAGAWTWKLLTELEAVMSRTDRLRLALSAGDIRAAKAGGYVAAMLAIEGGEAIGTSLDELRAFYARGVRLMTLTWSRRNAIGRGVTSEGSDGLSVFGRQVVAEMERLGMIVDASHLSDEALEDLLAVAKRPVVASHSNSRELCKHPRNLKDEQAKRIAATGGLVALTFAGVFVDEVPEKVTMARFLEHMDRMVETVGADHVGLGSDFDGWTEKYGVVLADCTGLPSLTEALLKRGYAKDEVAKIMGGNWLRVIEEIVG
jgi:membrane dipeptidase